MAYTDPAASENSRNVIVNTVGLTVNSAGSSTFEHVFLSERVYLQREGSRVDWMVLTIITTCK